MKQTTHYLLGVLLLGTLTSVFSSGDLFSLPKSIIIYGLWAGMLAPMLIKDA